MMRRLIVALIVLCSITAPAQAQDYLTCQKNGIVTVCPGSVRLKTGTLGVSYLPTGIPATSIGAGTVSNTTFGYLDATSSIQAQLNAKVAATRSISTGTGLQGGGDLSADRTISIDATVATLTGAQILTNKTINCANNTCTVRLGSDVSGVLPVANGGTNSSTALGNNRPMVSSGGKIVETASACAAGTILAGGTAPDCTATPTVATSMTVPLVTSTSALILNAATGNAVGIQVNGSNILQATASGLSASQSLGMNSQKITAMAQGTASGEALAYPWIGSVSGSASLSAASFSLSTGAMEDVGLSLSIPSAGTYAVEVDVRASVQVSASAGGYIECEIYNSTDAAAVANSERIVAQANVLNQLMQNTAPIRELVTVAGAKTLKLYCGRFGGSTFTISTINSDSNGRTRGNYVKIHDQ